MTRHNQMLKRVCITLLTLILCLWLTNEVYASYRRTSIQKIIAVIKELPNEATITDASERLQAGTGRKAVPSLDADGSKKVEYSFVVPQGGVRRLGRVFWFTVTLKFDGADRLASKRVLFTSNSNSCCFAEVWELASFAGPERGELQVARYDPYSIIVHMGSHVSPAESRAAWNWQLSCLTSIAGCEDVRQVLPSLRPSYRRK